MRNIVIIGGVLYLLSKVDYSKYFEFSKIRVMPNDGSSFLYIEVKNNLFNLPPTKIEGELINRVGEELAKVRLISDGAVYKGVNRFKVLINDLNVPGGNIWTIIRNNSNLSIQGNIDLFDFVKIPFSSELL